MKKRCFAIVLIMCMLLLTACGYRADIKIKSDRSYTLSEFQYYRKSELKDYDLKAKDAKKKITVKGTTYYGYEEDNPKDDYDFSKYEKSMTLNSSKAEIPVSTIGEDTDNLVITDAFIAGLDFFQYRIKYPHKVLKANGSISKDGYTVTYDLCKILKDAQKGVRMYATFKKSASSSKKLTIKGIKNGKVYSSARTIKVSSPGLIKSLTLNGRETKGNSFKVKKNGKYTVKVKLLSGKTKTVKFTIKKK